MIELLQVFILITDIKSFVIPNDNVNELKKIDIVELVDKF